MPEKRLERLQEAFVARGTTTAAETPRDRLWTAVIVLSVILVLVGLVNFALWRAVLDVQRFQEDGKQRGYETRAVACSNMAQDGKDLPDPCLQPEVAALYDLSP